MTIYRVEYTYRNDNGMNYSIPTDRASVTVEADTADKARGAAIVLAHTQEGISHVRICSVRLGVTT